MKTTIGCCSQLETQGVSGFHLKPRPVRWSKTLISLTNLYLLHKLRPTLIHETYLNRAYLQGRETKPLHDRSTYLSTACTHIQRQTLLHHRLFANSLSSANRWFPHISLVQCAKVIKKTECCWFYPLFSATTKHWPAPLALH